MRGRGKGVGTRSGGGDYSMWYSREECLILTDRVPVTIVIELCAESAKETSSIEIGLNVYLKNSGDMG